MLFLFDLNIHQFSRLVIPDTYIIILFVFKIIKDQGSLQLRKDATIGKGKGKKHPLKSSQPVRRLRLRGDWSDTGPDARPEREGGRRSGTGKVIY